VAHQADEPAYAVRLKGPEESPIASLAHRPSMAGMASRSMGLHNSYLENRKGLEHLSVFFQIASGLLTVEVVLWIIAETAQPYAGRDARTLAR
jgi:hypothetical protein